MSILDALNEEQRRAAAWPGGPMLILAGAGSGKTRVITHRIAHLLDDGVPPWRIVGMTFTNRAAREMRERVLRLLGREEAENASLEDSIPWLGTFHAYCLRLLRREVAATPLQPGFLVYAADDSRAVVKAALREVGIDDRDVRPRRVAGRISRFKAQALGPEDIAGRFAPDHDPVEAAALAAYPEYQARLIAANACDFDDLLLHAVRLLEEHDEVRERWQERVEHLLVDEYQDTNRLQYRLIRLLIGRHGNVCAVGDEDQSIYRFRGADVGNILRFEDEFPGTEVFRIEQNYRSTGNILAAANAVVERNVERKGKSLWTEEPAGDPVRVVEHASSEDEADAIASEIARLDGDISRSDVAILYRVNAQSRPFEQALSARGLPHVVIGSTRFYERKEVRDILAYLRLVANPADDVAFERIVNVPARGIGEVTKEAVRRLARERSVSLWSALDQGLREGVLPPRAEAALDRFLTLVEGLAADAAELELPGLVERVIEETDYRAELQKEGRDVAADREANLAELVTAASLHATRVAGGDLATFLGEITLSSETDQIGDDGSSQRVHLMTLHSAKGLEFDVVFLCGLEEELLPHASSSHDEAALEEERRLCYVGMTRARRRLVLSSARHRFLAGRSERRRPSRFLSELPTEGIERSGGAGPSFRPSTRLEGGTRLSASQQAALSGFFGSGEATVAVPKVEPEDVSQDHADDDGPVYQYGAAEAEATSPATPVPATPAMPSAPAPRRGATRPTPRASGWCAGDLVRHADFGMGKVVGVEQLAGKQKLTIYFESGGRRKLVAEHAPIERVG